MEVIYSSHADNYDSVYGKTQQKETRERAKTQNCMTASTFLKEQKQQVEMKLYLILWIEESD